MLVASAGDSRSIGACRYQPLSYPLNMGRRVLVSGQSCTASAKRWQAQPQPSGGKHRLRADCPSLCMALLLTLPRMAIPPQSHCAAGREISNYAEECGWVGMAMSSFCVCVCAWNTCLTLRSGCARGCGEPAHLTPAVANELVRSVSSLPARFRCRCETVVLGSRGLGITKRALFNLLAVGSGEQAG